MGKSVVECKGRSCDYPRIYYVIVVKPNSEWHIPTLTMTDEACAHPKVLIDNKPANILTLKQCPLLLS